MTRIKVLFERVGNKARQCQDGVFREFHLFTSDKHDWEHSIEKTHPIFNNLEIKQHYSSEGDPIAVWELEFEEEAGGRPERGKPKVREWWKNGDISVKFVRERERERAEPFQFNQAY